MFVAVFFNSFVMAWPLTGLWCNLVEMLGILGAQEPSASAAGSLGHGQYGCPGRWVAHSVPLIIQWNKHMYICMR